MALRLTTGQARQMVKQVTQPKAAPKEVAPAAQPFTGTIRLVLPMAPSANRNWRNYGGRTVTSTEAREFKAQAGWIAGQSAPAQPLTCDVSVSMWIYRERNAGDIDNRAKLALDSMNKIIYDDDKRVAELHIYRRKDKDNPRIEVEITGI